MFDVLHPASAGLTADGAPKLQVKIQFSPAASVISIEELDLLESILPDIIKAMLAMEAETIDTHDSERKAELCT
jgi:hypothetical protein